MQREMFIERRANIEQLLQSPASSSLAIQDLEIVKIHNVNMVKLKSCDAFFFFYYRGKMLDAHPSTFIHKDSTLRPDQ